MTISIRISCNRTWRNIFMGPNFQPYSVKNNHTRTVIASNRGLSRKARPRRSTDAAITFNNTYTSYCKCIMFKSKIICRHKDACIVVYEPGV